MQKNFNEADHTAREEAWGGEEQGRRHTADGNQHLHLGDATMKKKSGTEGRGW